MTSSAHQPWAVGGRGLAGELLHPILCLCWALIHGNRLELGGRREPRAQRLLLWLLAGQRGEGEERRKGGRKGREEEQPRSREGGRGEEEERKRERDLGKEMERGGQGEGKGGGGRRGREGRGERGRGRGWRAEEGGGGEKPCTPRPPHAPAPDVPGHHPCEPRGLCPPCENIGICVDP